MPFLEWRRWCFACPLFMVYSRLSFCSASHTPLLALTFSTLNTTTTSKKNKIQNSSKLFLKIWFVSFSENFFNFVFSSGSPFDMNDFTSFNTLQGALLALFQVVTQSRWVDYVYGYGYQFSLELSMFYFCFYHMFSILFFMSLLQGVIWEVFGVVEEYFR